MIMNREEVRELQDERQSGHEPPRHDQTSFAKLETTTTTRFPGAAPTPIQAEALLWEPLSAQDYLNGAMPESDSEETLDLFQEPEGYFRPEQKPTEAQYESRRGTMTMRLVGHNPLWVGRCPLLAVRHFILTVVVGPSTVARRSDCCRLSRSKQR